MVATYASRRRGAASPTNGFTTRAGRLSPFPGTARIALCATSRKLAPAVRERLDAEHSRADEIRELRQLLGAEHGVHAREGLQHCVAQPLGALDAQGDGIGRLGRVELIEPERVGEPGGDAAVVHRGLGALRLQL